jgi:hypothetical protein
MRETMNRKAFSLFPSANGPLAPVQEDSNLLPGLQPVLRAEDLHLAAVQSAIIAVISGQRPQ